MRKQDLRVPVRRSQMSKKLDRSQIVKFQRDTQGMSQSQKLEYLMMSESEKDKCLKSLNIVVSENDVKDSKQKKGKVQPTQKDITVKIIKKGQISQTSVIVLNMRGKPLMPTSPRKARLLLKEGKAKVVKKNPFTIQLKYATGENKQPIKLALDPGYKNVGFSAITNKRELMSGEVILRTDIKEKIAEKSMYRRGRRNRNTRYREARWKNRGKNKGKKEGWLAPSIQHKLDTYTRLVTKFDNILPLLNITVETSPFDMQKMQNPEISGIEYQQGELQGYEVKEYLLEKWGRKCAYCKTENVPLETEHIIPTSRGGTNRVSNLTIACHSCNQKKSNMTAAEFGHPEIQILAKKPLKDATFMNIVRSRLVDTIKKEFPQYQCNETYGYITKCNRIKMGIEKSHANDAFVIAGGRNQIRSSKPYQVIQTRRNNRSLQINRKGFKPSIRRNRYKYSPGDLIKRKSLLQTTGWGEKVDNKIRKSIYTVKGIFNYGEWIRLENNINIKTNDVRISKYGSGLCFQLAKKNNGDIEKKDKVKKLNKKEQKIIDMKFQKSIDDSWN